MQAFNTVKIQTKLIDRVVYLGFGVQETKSMTTFTPETLQELKVVLESLSKDSHSYQGLIFHTLKDGCFLAGVDVDIIRSLSTQQLALDGASAGQAIFNMIEDLPFPTVAAVDGVCLGGGLELALACRYLLASDQKKTKLGLPEVQLGVLPGFGGTYRLPKKIGLTQALDLIFTGKQLDAKRALRAGLVDLVVPKERLLSWALKVIHAGLPTPKKTSTSMTDHLAQTGFFRRIIFQKAREKVLKQTKGFYPAPLKILEHLEKSAGRDRKDYLQNEAQAFAQLTQTAAAKNLQQVFFLTDRAKKNPDATQPLWPALLPHRGAVIGAGTMGGGIAWLLAEAGMMPVMKDLNQKALELGHQQANQNFTADFKKKKISFDELERKKRSILSTTRVGQLGTSGLIIEAVVEDLAIKQKVLAQLEGEISPEALLTTNTSSLSISLMAQSLKLPQRFAGLHFFNPVHKMPLVEIITHSSTSMATIVALHQWCLKVKKIPVIVKDGPGFLVNRLLGAYLNEAAYLLASGVGIEAIEQAATDFGLPMGPFRLMDEVGLDVADKVAKILHQGLGERYQSNQVTKDFLDRKALGRKTALGFYEYPKQAEGEIQLSAQTKQMFGGSKRSMDSLEIQQRLVVPMINEACYLLAEELVADASTIDVALIYGIGFPPFKGGLMKFADLMGLGEIVDLLKTWHQQDPAARYVAHPLLAQKAVNASCFIES